MYPSPELLERKNKRAVAMSHVSEGSCVGQEKRKEKKQALLHRHPTMAMLCYVGLHM
jgi:hypothetical protein